MARAGVDPDGGRPCNAARVNQVHHRPPLRTTKRSSAQIDTFQISVIQLTQSIVYQTSGSTWQRVRNSRTFGAQTGHQIVHTRSVYPVIGAFQFALGAQADVECPVLAIRVGICFRAAPTQFGLRGTCLQPTYCATCTSYAALSMSDRVKYQLFTSRILLRQSMASCRALFG